MATQPPESSGDAPIANASGKKGTASFMPALLAAVAAPALTWAVCQFVLIPQFRAELDAGPASASATASSGAERGGHVRSGSDATSSKNGYKFENIVVNLAGTMGTRYLKTTFLVTGADAHLVQTFQDNHAVLVDVTLNVLSSLSLTDLEEAGSKNLIREKLVQSYNQALGRKVAEQVFFSDFVVQ